MTDKNWEVEIATIKGDVKLLNFELDTIKNNHLKHIQKSIDTLNRISHSNDALGVQALYQAKTKGGDTRHLLQHSTGRPTKYNLEVMDYLLRDAIKQNPEYSDTLTTQELPLVKEGMQKSGNIIKSLLNMIMGS